MFLLYVLSNNLWAHKTYFKNIKTLYWPQINIKY